MKKLLILVLSFTALLTAYPPAGTLHDIDVDFQSTFSIIESLENDSGTQTLIHQNDLGATGYIISSPGHYALGESISFSPVSAASAITINTDNVHLDLNCFMLSQENSQPGVNGITINSSQNNLSILNGMISNFSNNGIEVGNDVDGLNIQATLFEDNARGIHFNGSQANPITSASINNIELIGSTTALHLISTNGSRFNDLIVFQSLNAAFDITESFTNIFKDITINGVNSTSNAYGFKLENGGNNQILSNVITGISTSSTDTVNKAVGIEIGRYEESSQFGYNQISTIATLTAALAGGNAFGINMLYTFTALSNSGLPSQEYNQNGAGNPNPGVYSVAWSPDGRYLAIGQTQLTDVGGTNFTELGIIRILQFNGTSFTEITSITYDDNGAGNPDPGVYSVAWSPDGQYLAIGQTQLTPDGGGNTNLTELGIIRILQFNGTSLIEIDAITYDAGGADAGVYSVAWSPDGRYLAIGQTQLTADGGGDTNFTELGIIRILQFNGTSLIEIDAITYDAGGADAGVYSVAWSPDGRYLAIGQTQLTATGGGNTNFTELGIIRILQFDGTSLTQITSITDNDNGAGNPDPGVYSVAWSPDGQYLAIGQTQLTADVGGNTNFTELGIIRILQFNNTSLTAITSITYNDNGAGNPDPGVYSVAWSPDGRYLAIGQTQLTTDVGAGTNLTELGIIRILQFNGTSLTEITSITYDAGGADAGVYSVAWSSDGRYIATGQTQLTDSNSTTNFTELGIVRILSSFQFSANHSITDNIISNVVGPELALTFSAASAISSGRGMQATSNNNSIYTNRVNNSNLAYTFVASEQYLQNVENLKLENQFPNVLSNVSNNSDYQFARTRNSP